MANTVDTSTEAVERMISDLSHDYADGRELAASDMIRALLAERDTLARQVEDCARTCAEQAEQILNLQNACKAVLPLMQAADREEVTDVQDWHAAEALIHAALEGSQ
ncbi:hypothetical protein P5P81_03450 [Tritonibacter mobilis]|nr:hypothetical protein [Tritonibacter mobilis]